MAKKKTESGQAAIIIKKVVKQAFKVIIAGLDMVPYMQHKFDRKHMQAILVSQFGLEIDHLPKDPILDWQLAGHSVTDGMIPRIDGRWWALPMAQVKSACVLSTKHLSDVASTEVGSALHFIGDYVKIQGPGPVMDERIAMIGNWKNRVPDPRHRPIFMSWWAELTVEVIPSILSVDSAVNLIEASGTLMGIGEMRPEKKKGYGMYRIVTPEEFKKLKLQEAEPRSPESIDDLMQRWERYTAGLRQEIKRAIDKKVKGGGLNGETKEQMEERIMGLIFRQADAA